MSCKIRVSEIIDDTRLKCFCPFHDDDNPSLRIDLDKGAYCFAGCYKGDLVGLISKVTGENRVLARLHVLDAFEFDIETQHLPGAIPAFFKNHTTDYQNAKDWFQKQGFTFKTALYWKIDFSLTSFSFPIRDFNSNTVGVVTRNISSSPKYIHNEGFKKNVLFGENFLDTSKPVIVVEGFLDVFYLWQLGYNVCALMGVVTTDEQLEKLKTLNIHMVIFDEDVAGRNGIKKLKDDFPNVIGKTLNVRKITAEKLKEDIGLWQ